MDFDVAGFLKLVVAGMVPYALASQGTMIGGRAGVFSVAQEGVMLVGASAGFLGAYKSESLLIGIVIAALVGGVFGLALSYLTTTLKFDQFVVGLALFFLGVGLSSLLYKVLIGVTLEPPSVEVVKAVAIPLLSRIPVVGEILFDQDLFVFFTILLSVLLYWLLYKTSWGLKLLAVGERPMAADGAGVDVARTRYVTTITGGMLMALGGAYLPMVYTGTFTEGMTNGRGWLAIALTFFGGWRPHLILFGSLFFAGMEILGFQTQVRGVGTARYLLNILPYLGTIVVMMFAFKWTRVPGFLGRNYHREGRTTA